MFKVIGTSNYNIETMNETLAAESIPTEEMAKLIATVLNGAYCNVEGSPVYYVVQPQSHVLYVWEP